LLAARFKDREHLSSSSKPRFQASFEARCSGHIARTGSFPSILLTVRGLVARLAASNAQTGAVMTGS
jgi:hypothetical protein